MTTMHNKYCTGTDFWIMLQRYHKLSVILQHTGVPVYSIPLYSYSSNTQGQLIISSIHYNRRAVILTAALPTPYATLNKYLRPPGEEMLIMMPSFLSHII